MLAAVLWTTGGTSPAASSAGQNRLTIVDRPLNLDRDRLFEGLELTCDAVFESPGTWDVEAALSTEYECTSYMYPGTAYDLTREDLLRAWTSGAEGDHLTRVETDSLGRVHFMLYFDGNDLARLFADGPWKLCIRGERIVDSTSHAPAARRRATVVQLHATTRAWSRARFDTRYSGELAHYPSPFFDCRGGEELVFTQGWDLIVVTVTGADTGGTRAHPPRVDVHVDRMLQGRVPGGTLGVRWMPEPLDLPCLTGEEDSIARWGRSSYPAPLPGSRWILGGAPAGAGPGWLSFERARWVYSDSLVAHFEAAARKWGPKLKKLRRQLDTLYGPQIREAQRADRRARHTRDSTQYANDRLWLARARRTAQDADLASLVDRSTYILVGEINLDTYSPPRQQAASMRVEQRLRWNARMNRSDVVPMRIMPREDSVALFWHGAPSDLQPGPEPGPAVRCVAFAERSVIPDREARPVACLRLVDGTQGLLIVDDTLLARLQRVLAESPDTSAPDRARAAVTWRDFAGLHVMELQGTGIKLTPLHRGPSTFAPECPLLLGCTLDSTNLDPPFLTEWFWNHALPDSLYRMEYEGQYWRLPTRADEMARLLDTLTTLPRLRDRWVSPADSFSLTLRREVKGRELLLECTLDRASQERVARILLDASVVNDGAGVVSARRAPSDRVRWNVPTWVEAMWPGARARYQQSSNLPAPRSR